MAGLRFVEDGWDRLWSSPAFLQRYEERRAEIREQYRAARERATFWQWILLTWRMRSEIARLRPSSKSMW